MFLKKIYANGFKSFAEKTEVVVEKGITAIVGPNGSGKSNISDAIKWVLGEQSAKSLRGGKMEDVIFSGTEKRKPLGYAEVNLIFDNQNKILPIEYREVSIKRKLYKTGESEYYINKQQCRLKDIKELFMDTGIGRDGYSVIGQGRVEDILSPNSDVRRAVFEEAAGIVKFKSRKEEALRKLEKTNDNLDRVEDIVFELEKRIEPLKEQSEKTRKYVELKDVLKKYELNYFVQEYEKHKSQSDGLEEQKKNATNSKVNLQKKRDEIENTIIDEKEKIHILEIKLAEIEEKKHNKAKEYEHLVNLCQVEKEKIILYKSNMQNLLGEVNLFDQRNQELQEKIKSIELEKSLCEQNLKIHLEKFKEMNSEILNYKTDIDKIIELIENKKNELFELHKNLNKLNSTKSTFESFLKNDSERIEQLLKEIQLEQDENSNKQEIVNNLDIEKNEIKHFLQLKKEEYENTLLGYKKIENEKNKTEDTIKIINDRLSSEISKLNIWTNMEAYYDGYYKSVQNLMKYRNKDENINKSILGTVADIIKTKKEYETAIEISLGSSIQNIIVNSELDAEHIIDYLKINKIGRVTFLPINLIKERNLNSVEKSILSESCVINTADMLVNVEPKFEKVVKHLLGRIIIVDNIQNGFKISKRLHNSIKIVSLQGDVINAGGSVTGGHTNSNQSLLSRKREIVDCKNNIENLKKELKNNNDELNLIINNIKEYNKKIESIKVDINDKNNLYSMNQSKYNMLQEQISKTKLLIEKYLNEKQYMINQKNKHLEQIKELEYEIIKHNNIIEKHEQDIEKTVIENKDKKIKYDEFNDIILKHKDEVALLNQDIKLNEEKINNILSEISRNHENKNIKKEQISNTQKNINNSTVLINQYTKEIEKFDIELLDINKEHVKRKESLTYFQNQIYEYQNTINKINKDITEMLDDENKMNIKIEKAISKTEDISTKLWEEYEMNYAMALSFKDEGISFNKIYTEMNLYKNAIKELGNINMDSIEEYDEVKTRYDFLTTQKNDLVYAKSQLNNVIKELETKMKEQFLEEFVKIRVKFNEVFQKLFSGGKGDVYIEDETDALNSSIEITVQPPGKRLSKISLLSGGEKSLTAIALLFAILKTKPTPFCILDEIEAALDDSNIYRFTQYLKEFSKETQFLVITHRKGTMEYADNIYGTTMEEKGVTKLVSLKLTDTEF